MELTFGSTTVFGSLFWFEDSFFGVSIFRGGTFSFPPARQMMNLAFLYLAAALFETACQVSNAEYKVVTVYVYIRGLYIEVIYRASTNRGPEASSETC